MKNYIQKNKLKKIIEPIFHEYLDQDIYEIKYVKPISLISNMRFDLFSKLSFLDGINNKSNNYEDLYYSFINAFSLGDFLEPGNPKKVGFESFVKSFNKTFYSVKEEGFLIKNSIIPISNNGVILNGSHRLACAIKTNLSKIPCIQLNVNSPTYNYEFFQKRKVPQVFLDQSAKKLVQIDKDIYAAIVWPAGNKSNINFEDYIPNIFFKKEIMFSFNGLKNLISNVYLDEEWLGSIERGHPGAINKALPCYSKSHPLTLYLFKPNNKKEITFIKNKIRNIIGIGKNSIHINDYHEEVLQITKFLLNTNSIHFLNNLQVKNLPKNFLKQIDEFKKFINSNDISFDKVALDGSMVLASYCLRKARDIDFIIDTNEREKIKDLNNLRDEYISIHNDHVSKFYKLKIDRIIDDSRNHFIFLGIKFVSIKLILDMKFLRNETKDRIDINLINTVYSPDFIRSYIFKVSQIFILKAFKIRNYIIILLKRLKIFNIVKRGFLYLKKIFYLLGNIFYKN